VDYSVTADYYKGNIEDGYVSYVWTDYLTRERLVELRNNLERTVRAKLSIPYNPSVPAQRYEHSMGQNNLPQRILKRAVSNETKTR
jgi:hypothetical protein